jgi:Carboxypeptidase regulatory-like domain
MLIAGKTHLLKRAAFLFMTVVCLILAGCEKAKVVGQVVDQNDSPLESVHISISNSELSTQSNNEGKYKINYLPGKFSVEFKKNGYANSSIQLEIDTESRFPAKKVILWKVPVSRGVFLLEGGDYIPLKESSVSIRGNLMQTITGIKTPSLLQIKTQTPIFVFYGAEYPTDGLFLSRIGYMGTKKIQGVFGATRQKINLWTASREKSQIKSEEVDSNLSVVRLPEPLSVGNYAFHWGILFAGDPIATSAMQNKAAYDFTISAISSKKEDKLDGTSEQKNNIKSMEASSASNMDKHPTVSNPYIASSFLPKSKFGTYVPNNLFDGNPNTPWCEGATGDGIGEWAAIFLGKGSEMDGAQDITVNIASGYQKNGGSYMNNGRPTKIKIEIFGGNKMLVAGEAEGKYSRATLTFKNVPSSSEGIWLKATILEVETGKKWKDTCMSEIRPSFSKADAHNARKFAKGFCDTVNGLKKGQGDPKYTKLAKKLAPNFTSEFDEASGPTCNFNSFSLLSEDTFELFGTEGGDGGLYVRFERKGKDWTFKNTGYYTSF